MRRFSFLVVLLLVASSAFADESPTVRDLASCVALALEKHPSIGGAAASVEAGEARSREALSGYLPSVDASYSLSRSRTSSVSRGSTTQVGRSSTFTRQSTAVSLSQVLFDFGRNLQGMRASDERLEALRADAITARDAVVLGTKQAYFQLLASRRLLDVAEETFRQAQAQLEEARRRYAVGLAPRLEVTRSEIQEANADSDRLTARNDVTLARATLAEALGLGGALDFEIADQLSERPPIPSEDGALATARDSRPELKSARAQERARERDVAALESDHLPHLDGSASYGWSGYDDPLEPSWSVGLDVTLPIFQGGRTSAQVAEAEADRRALAESTRELENRIAREVRQALVELHDADQQIGVTDRAARLARDNLELATGRYHAGVSNVIELTDAQVTRATAEAQHVQALYAYQTALASLEQAVGASLDEDRGTKP